MTSVFITGTDTGIGKTYIGRILVKALINNSFSCVPRKPIESGCEIKQGELQPADALEYLHACKAQVSLDEICPYRFEPPISPERAIRLANQHVTTQDLVNVCSVKEKTDFVLVEGAGGIYSPLCSDGLNADLAVALNSKVILVVPDRLGCINQALLAIEAIQNRNLDLVAVVLNQYRPHDDSQMDNLDDLRNRITIPVIAVPLVQSADQEILDRQYNAIDELLAILKNLLPKK